MKRAIMGCSCAVAALACVCLVGGMFPQDAHLSHAISDDRSLRALDRTGLRVPIHIDLPTEAPYASRTKPYVRGFLFALAPDKQQRDKDPLRKIYLPEIDVYLLDPTSRAVKSHVKTDLSGRFNFPSQPAGRYQLCWHATGFVNGCAPSIIEIKATPVYAGEIELEPVRSPTRTSMFGRVRMLDGRIPRTFEPIANINSYARIAVIDASNQKLSEAAVNNNGEYFIPSIPNDRRLLVRTTLEALSEDRSIAQPVLASGIGHRMDIVLHNRAPKIEGTALLRTDGSLARFAGAGEHITVRANISDPDGEPVNVKWITDSDSGTLASASPTEAAWALPSAPGPRTATVIAFDGRGGYAKSTVSIDIGRKGVRFSGKVDGSDTPLIANAEVSVNGETTKTNAGGFFTLDAKDASRFVLNIRKEGYVLLSHIYDRSQIAGHWTLTKAHTVKVDPNLPIDLIDPRDKRECYIPFSSRANWDTFVLQRRPLSVDRKSGSVLSIGALPYDDKLFERAMARRRDICGQGISIHIPAKSLVDAHGNPPDGPVEISMSTVDALAPFEMWGDYTVQQPADKTAVMETWGAGWVEISRAGKQYNLKPNTIAKLTIPISDIQLAYPAADPNTIPLLTYDEKRGVWLEDGIAKRNGNVYEAEVKHFSAFNCDLVKNDQACVRIYSPPPSDGFAGLPPAYKLEVTIPQSPGKAPKVLEKEVINSSPYYHVLYNLPTNVNIVLVPYSYDGVPYGTFIVNTGGPQNPERPNLPSAADNYAACQAQVVLYDVGLPEPPTDAFLHGLYSFAATNLDEPNATTPTDPNDPNTSLSIQLDNATNDYYRHVDPRHQRATLDRFKSFNGIDGTGETNARYCNAADLGFGRDMHAKKRGSSDGHDDIAFYVTNYGQFDTPDEDDFKQAVDADPNTIVATVAMEWSRIEDDPADPNNPENPADPIIYSDGERAIKFYVYNKAGNRVNAANLDGFGARPVPQLCVVCHGGEVPYPGGSIGISDGAIPAFASRDSVKLGSLFLPFDLSSLTIVNGYSPAYDKAAQQQSFFDLNQLVKSSQPGPVITDIIDKMYPTNSPPQVEGFVVSGWDGEEAKKAMYVNVLGRSCRMCHSARPPEINRDIRLHRFDDFVRLFDPNSPSSGGLYSVAEARVCDTKQMPHARITFGRFWGSYDPAQPFLFPFQPAQMIAFGETYSATFPQLTGFMRHCAAPDPNVVPPPPATFAAVQSIFDNNCTFCHEPGGEASFLSLLAGVSHGNIFNQPASELSTMNRVTPNDPNNSYLWHKVIGDQSTVGGSGVQMPKGLPALTSGEQDAIKQWILAGAPASP